MDKPAPAAYPIHPLLAGRWSPRAFDPRPVPPEIVRTLLEAARWAPSCYGAQPWRLLVAERSADPEGHRRLAGLLTGRNIAWAPTAPLLILSVAHERFTHNDTHNRWAAHDVGLAVAQLTVQASALGLVVHQMGGFDRARAERELGLPESYTPLALIAVGYPGDPEALPEPLRALELAPRARLPHDAWAFGARFGEPLKTTADWERVLDFWFGPLDADGLASDERAARWFRKDPEFDAEIARRFAEDHTAAARGERDAWLAGGPRGRLAWIVMLDQFSRNMFRGTPEMYAYDAPALEAALAAIAAGEDEALATAERVFLYLPLMHSESLAHQEACVERFARLRDGLTGRAREHVARNYEYAVRHRDIVARFGRFPHRNAILGRPSTAEEEAFLKEPGSSF